MRLSHIVQHLIACMLGCNLKLTAYMMLDKLPHKLIVFILYKIVVADTRTDKHLFYALYITDFTKHSEILAVVNG